MANTPRDKLAARFRTFDEYVEAGDIDAASAAAIREVINAYDERNVTVSKPAGEGYREPATLMSWLYRLAIFARERDLTTATAAELNADIQAMLDGTHRSVKDDGLTMGTLRSYQAALRVFYGYHDGFSVTPDEIQLFDKADTHIDPADMLTKEEIHMAREAADNVRDLLIFDLLLYTGMRRGALRTLRVKDVDVQAGEWRFNSEVDGLKKIHQPFAPRPLLMAKATVRDWLEYHPDPQPDNYLVTARPNFAAVDPSVPIAGETVRRVMADIKADAGIEKPMHPHAMRHNFVTICKRNYRIPDDTVKFLIGHHPASNVMETTYSHLSGDDHIQRANEGAGLVDPEDESPFTPDACRYCSAPLAPNAKACSRCGYVYTPDAVAVVDRMNEDMKASYAVTAPDENDTLDELGELDALLADPAVKAALLDRLGVAE
ncbi:tyrosine-type recombinase/integrase [Halomarina salina]|uniref:Tyrosine-type recombinase/integrase n=1 Tax=Halomarina salina TaxID=1872699 RepID=A0ABD5RMS7_9EURY|nr:site-specific integrase [Halomarina salina]